METTVRNPYDGSVVTELVSDHPQRDGILNALAEAPRAWRQVPPAQRVAPRAPGLWFFGGEGAARANLEGRQHGSSKVSTPRS